MTWFLAALVVMTTCAYLCASVLGSFAKAIEAEELDMTY